MVDFPKPQRLGEMFGWGDNPFYKTFDANRNAVIQGFSNIGSNPLNPGAGFSQGFAQGSLMDQQRAEEEQQQFEQQGQTNATRAWLEQQGYNDLIPLVEAGQADIAFGEALKRMQPGYGQAEAIKPIEINGQLVDPTTGQVMGDYRDPQTGPAAPSGYEWDAQTGGLRPIQGGPADPAVTAIKPATDAERRGAALTSVVDSDAALLLGDGVNPGVFEQLADTGDQFKDVGAFGVNPFRGQTSAAYQQAQSAVENIAQSYLYAISGQAAPAAEVEKIVNSITPRPFENPAVLAEKKRRLAEYVDAIRMSAGRHAPGGAGDGWEVIGVQ